MKIEVTVRGTGEVLAYDLKTKVDVIQALDNAEAYAIAYRQLFKMLTEYLRDLNRRELEHRS